LQGRCLSYGAAIPYVPVVDTVRANCGMAEADPPEAIAEKARFGLQELGLDSGESMPYLLRLLGGKDPDGQLEALGPEVIKARTFEVLRQMCLRGSRRRPLVLEVEDLHWVDRTSEEYFTYLAESLAYASILLVATYRPGYRPPGAIDPRDSDLARPFGRRVSPLSGRFCPRRTSATRSPG
jgi:predicted ATPase